MKDEFDRIILLALLAGTAVGMWFEVLAGWGAL